MMIGAALCILGVWYRCPDVFYTGHIPNIYPLYALGTTLLEIGVLPGYDMTHEAAFAKLSWLVSRNDLTFAQRQELFQTPIAGEMSV